MSASSVGNDPAILSPRCLEKTQDRTSSQQRHLWRWRDLEWGAMFPFIAMHVGAVVGSWWSGFTTEAVIAAVVLYFIRMFGITGGYHRYFAHRVYRTSRWFQFVLAFLAETSAQRGVLWWAAHHRRHHRFSDQAGDVHSPRLSGFLYAHMLWLYHGNHATNFDRVRDFAKYPELRFLNRYWLLPPTLLGAGMLLWMGWSGFFVGFVSSTVLAYHGTFTINSLSHVIGSRRFETADDSRNNWVLALVTMGEGWHNNHHHYMHSTRQGFYWWEVDVTYLILRGLALLGLVWDLREPPARVYEEALSSASERKIP